MYFLQPSKFVNSISKFITVAALRCLLRSSEVGRGQRWQYEIFKGLTILSEFSNSNIFLESSLLFTRDREIDSQKRLAIVAISKGQLISGWIDEVTVSPKIRTKNCRDFWPHRGEILTIFRLYYGRNDDFINSFWKCVTFRTGSNLFAQKSVLDFFSTDFHMGA